MVFTGSAGTGKTTVARALCEELNLDYIINIVDVVILFSIILENTTPTDIQSNLADMNYDGNINISDIILLINTILS